MQSPLSARGASTPGTGKNCVSQVLPVHMLLLIFVMSSTSTVTDGENWRTPSLKLHQWDLIVCSLSQGCVYTCHLCPHAFGLFLFQFGPLLPVKRDLSSSSCNSILDKRVFQFCVSNPPCSNPAHKEMVLTVWCGKTGHTQTSLQLTRARIPVWSKQRLYVQLVLGIRCSLRLHCAAVWEMIIIAVLWFDTDSTCFRFLVFLGLKKCLYCSFA